MVAGILFGCLISSGNLSAAATGNCQQACRLGASAFLHLIKCIIVPLIFSTLVVGIAGHTDDMKAVGRLALKSLLYFEIVTTVALFVGLGAVNWIRPGDGIVLSTSADAGQKLAQTKVTFEGVVEHLTPQSFFDAAARNDVLQIVIYALFFGVALAQVKGKPKQTVLDFFDGITAVMFKFTGLVMCFAPFGVAAAIASTVGQNGLGILLNLGKLVLTLYGALLAFVVGVLIPVMWIARIPVGQFFRAVRQPALLAFSTATSEAALPDALRLMEKFGVPRRIVSFVLPAGYSFNLDGSTLYLALASVFVAQAAGVALDFSTQLMMMLTLMLTSKGVAAVPRASLVILSGTLATFGLPLEGVAIILGVDAFLDMARTSINLVGNCLASAVMARWEGEFDDVAANNFSTVRIETR
ncbi:MAG: cation:dicarboxylase symporter family transporter, partial [Verrucomicrobiota bacterium]